MTWWQKNRDKVHEEQKKAEQAVIMAQVGYMDMANLLKTAERIARGHLQLQRNNHFGYKVYGVEPK